MKKLIVIAIVSVLAACGGKKQPATTPANKADTTDPTKGSTGGATYGGGSAAPAPAPTGGAPSAM